MHKMFENEMMKRLLEKKKVWFIKGNGDYVNGMFSI